MREEKFITQAEYERARATPLQVVQKNPFETEDAMETFIEEVRKFIASEFGNTALYKKGLKVYTTVNATLQQSAFAAVQKGVREQDKRRGWRKDKLNLLAEGREIGSFAPGSEGEVAGRRDSPRRRAGSGGGDRLPESRRLPGPSSP